jgi:hypothetical protein
MAYAKITFIDPTGKITRIAPVGFSWTTLFFCFLPALFRWDLWWAFIILICLPLTGGLSWLVFPFIYNKLYIKDLINKAYKVKAVTGRDLSYISSKLGVDLRYF